MSGEGDFPARSAWLKPKKRPTLIRTQSIPQPGTEYKTVWNAWFFGATTGAYSVAATSGSFATTGGASALQSSRSLAASDGSFATSGQNAAILIGRSIDPNAGSIAVDGPAAAIALSRAVAAGAGDFDALGLDSTLYALRRISVGPGAFGFEGNDAELVVAGQQQEGGGLPEWALAELRSPVKSDRKFKISVTAGRFEIVGCGAAVRTGRSLKSHAQAFDARGMALMRVARGITTDRGIVGVAPCDIAVIHTTSPVARMRRRVAVLSAMKLAA